MITLTINLNQCNATRREVSNTSLSLSHCISSIWKRKGAKVNAAKVRLHSKVRHSTIESKSLMYHGMDETWIVCDAGEKELAARFKHSILQLEITSTRPRETIVKIARRRTVYFHLHALCKFQFTLVGNIAHWSWKIVRNKNATMFSHNRCCNCSSSELNICFQFLCAFAFTLV